METEETISISIDELILPETDFIERRKAFDFIKFPIGKVGLAFSDAGTLQLICDDATFHPTKQASGQLNDLLGFNPSFLPHDTDIANKMWDTYVSASDNADAEVDVRISPSHILQFGSGPDILEVLEEVDTLDDYKFKPLDIAVSKSKVRVDLIEPKYNHGTIYLGLSLIFSNKIQVEVFLYNIDNTSYIRYKDSVKPDKDDSFIEIVNNILELGSGLLSDLALLHDTPFEMNTGHRLLKDAGATSKGISKIMEQVVDMPDHTAYGLITFVGELGKDDKVEKLPYVAGELIPIYGAARCTHCGQMLGV